MKRDLVLTIILAGSLFGALNDSAVASEVANCYDLPSDKSVEGPERQPFGVAIPLRDVSEIDQWCFVSRPFSKVIFLNRQGVIDPETTLIVEKEKGETFFRKGHRIKGEVNYLITPNLGISPLGIPLEETTFQVKFSPKRKMIIQTQEIRNYKKVVEQLDALSKKVKIKSQIFDQEEEYLTDEKLPFRGYWWPHRGLPLSGGDDSPLAKYDRLVQERTGTDPQSRAWENTYHSLEHVDWGGHCNGWAASSVLYPDIMAAKYDERTDTTLSIGDLKGMLAEASFCVRWAFYGRRNNENEGDDPLDIHADRFHRVLRYYIKYVKKPIATDYDSGLSVDNHVITGYSMTMVPADFSTDSTINIVSRYKVTAQLRMHEYDSDISTVPGKAEEYNKDYEYFLDIDEDGNIVGGEWISENPDFLWVPLAQEKCGRENPRIHHSYVEEFMSLPNF